MEVTQNLNQKTPAKRTRLNVPVEFRRRYSRKTEIGQLKNISETGAFLAQKGTPLPARTKVHLSLEFLGNKREIVAEVVWSNSNGSGIQFLPHVGLDKLAVQDFIEYVQEQKASRYNTLDLIFKRVA